jgi:hypothetical protein
MKHGSVCICKHSSDSFPVQNDLKEGYVLLPMIFNFALECAIKQVQENQMGLKLNDTSHISFWHMLTT